MFTGLIQTTGSILSIENRPGTKRIAISAPWLAYKLYPGDSVAVSGVCLTALDIGPEAFHADLAAETVARTSLAHLEPGAVVNLELPTPAGTPLGGHIVQGHVDGTGVFVSCEPINPNLDPEDKSQTDWWLQVEVPENARPWIVEKGSIAIEGISLTVARWDGKTVTVAVIPHTWAATNLHTLQPGASVNIEADVLMKLAKQQVAASAFTLTTSYLVANGF
jgi:riboflavin synthase